MYRLTLQWAMDCSTHLLFMLLCNAGLQSAAVICTPPCQHLAKPLTHVLLKKTQLQGSQANSHA